MEQKKQALINVMYYGLIVALVYVALKYALPMVAPFVVAAVIVLILKGPARFLAGKLKVSEKTMRCGLLVVLYLLIAGLCVLFGAKILSESGKFISGLPRFYSLSILPAIREFSLWVQELAQEFDPAAVSAVNTAFDQAASTLAQRITEFSSMAIGVVSNILVSMPSMIVNTVLTVVSSFYIAADYDRITRTMVRHMPEQWHKVMLQIRSKFNHSVGIYIRSYALIFCMTWAELFIGLVLLRIPHGLLVSLLIAVCDIMPILGVGTVLIPWALVAAVMGRYPLAIGIGVLYLVITIIRNAVEPRLVGSQIGLHPLITLVSMIVGAHLFGLLGLFGFPVTLSILLPFYLSAKQQRTLAEGESTQ